MRDRFVCQPVGCSHTPLAFWVFSGPVGPVVFSLSFPRVRLVSLFALVRCEIQAKKLFHRNSPPSCVSFCRLRRILLSEPPPAGRAPLNVAQLSPLSSQSFTRPHLLFPRYFSFTLGTGYQNPPAIASDTCHDLTHEVCGDPTMTHVMLQTMTRVMV